MNKEKVDSLKKMLDLEKYSLGFKTRMRDDYEREIKEVEVKIEALTEAIKEAELESEVGSTFDRPN